MSGYFTENKMQMAHENTVIKVKTGEIAFSATRVGKTPGVGWSWL